MKQRLIGAAVLVLAAVIFVPMLLDQGGDEPPPAEHRTLPQPSVESPARMAPLEAGAPAPAAPVPAKSVAPKTPPAKASVKKSTKPAGAATPAAGTFAVQLGSFSKAENARALRDKLLAGGYAAFIEVSGSITRVYVGPQSSRAEAEKVLQKLLADTKLKGIVVNYSG